MLRLREVKSKLVSPLSENGDEMAATEVIEVVFEGPAGKFVECKFTIHMKPRPDDVTLISDAQELLAEAIGQLHHELAAST